MITSQVPRITFRLYNTVTLGEASCHQIATVRCGLPHFVGRAARLE